MAQPYDCGRKMALNEQIKTIDGVSNLVPFCSIWGMMN
jgi:hypothetical protein